MTNFDLLSGTFRHGVHPDEHKEATAHRAIERMPFVDRYILPLSQHLGASCRSLVETGATVQRGDVIGEPGGFVSTTLHSPVTGRVSAIGPRRHPNGQLVPAIEIEADPYATQRLASSAIDLESLPLDEFIMQIQRAGLVGMGGAA